MNDKQLFSGGEYEIGENVVLLEKQWQIKDIRKGVATLTHYDGTGQKSEQKMSLKDLPPKKIDVVSSPETDVKPALLEQPEYESGQKLSNGWTVVEPSVRGKYFVSINGSKQEMPGIAIAAAVRDFEKRRAEALRREAEEAEMHKQAEEEAMKEMAEMYGHEGPVEKLTMPDEADDEGEASEKSLSENRLPDEQTVMALLEKMTEATEAMQKVTTIEERITDTLTTKLAEMADRYDQRIRKIEKRLDGRATHRIAPTHEIQVEVKTLTSNHTQGADAELAALLSDGWRVLSSTDFSSKAIIRLIRVVATDEDEESTPERNVLTIPTRVVDVEGMTVEDVTAKYAHLNLNTMTAKMAMRWDAKIDENTRRVMGEQWYEKHGA